MSKGRDPGVHVPGSCIWVLCDSLCDPGQVTEPLCSFICRLGIIMLFFTVGVTIHELLQAKHAEQGQTCGVAISSAPFPWQPWPCSSAVAQGPFQGLSHCPVLPGGFLHSHPILGATHFPILLSCFFWLLHLACRVRDQRLTSCRLHWKCRVLTTRPPWKFSALLCLLSQIPLISKVG